MVGEYGISVYTRNNTRQRPGDLLGGLGPWSGTDASYYAQVCYKTPATGSGFDEFGSLGIHIFKRKMMGIKVVYYRSKTRKHEKILIDIWIL